MELSDVFYVPTWLFLIIIPAILYYINARKKSGYWSSKGINEVKATPVLLQLLSSKPVHEIELERYKKFGRLYGLCDGKGPRLSIADPELLKSIFVKDFGHFADRTRLNTGDVIGDNMVSVLQGESWKRVRTIITPAFTSGKLRKIVSLMKDSASTLVANFTKVAKEKKPCDGKSLFGAFAMDVICTSAFGTKIDSHNDPDNPIVSRARKIFSGHFNWSVLMMHMFPFLTKFIRFHILDPEITQFYKKVVLDIIQERKRTGKAPNDFLQLMMDASKDFSADEVDEEEDEQEKGNSKMFKKPISNKSLSIDELVAQAVMFFIAGYDTTATTLSFTAYFLAHNPEIQEKLIEEIDEMVPDPQKITYETVANLKYLDQVISETLRMCPVLTKIDRLCTEDYKLGDTGITIPKGMFIGIPVHGIHHDPEFYPDPETYNPDRFDPEVKATRHPFTYLPFGAGPRNCIGMRFGLLEMKICLATVFRQFRFRIDPNQGPLEYYVGKPMLQPKSLMINVESRTDV